MSMKKQFNIKTNKDEVITDLLNRFTLNSIQHSPHTQDIVVLGASAEIKKVEKHLKELK